MRFALPVVTLSLAMLLCGVASATSWIPMTMAEAVGQADLVAVGTTRGEGKAADSLVVERVFKGDVEEGEAVPFQGDSLELLMEPPIPSGRRNLFLLIRSEQGPYRLFHPISYLEGDVAARVEAVQRVQRMWADPAPFMEEQGEQPGEDLIHVLGEKLKALTVTSKALPGLEAEDLRFDQMRSNMIPWELRDRVTVRVRFDAERQSPVVFQADDPESPLLPYLKEQIEGIGGWDDRLAELEEGESVDVTLDTRGPERVAGRDAGEVRAYLRAALAADANAQRWPKLLGALAKARDLEAMDQVAALLDARGTMASPAARWLTLTRSPRAVQPLRRVLASAEYEGKGYQPLIEDAARGLLRLEAVEAMPELREAARHRVDDAAHMLGRFGGTDDFQLLLEAGNEKPTDTLAVQSGMRHLVQRSNLPVEEWMRSSTWSGQIGEEKQARWNQWWEEHRDEFVIAERVEAEEGGGV